MEEHCDNEEDLWSPETYKLKDITDKIPTLVRVKEGVYGRSEATSFSQGDLIRLDSCGPMQRIHAYLTRPGSKTRYEKYGNVISLPYNYNGLVCVQPMHGPFHKYSSVEELIAYFPRYVTVLTVIDKDDAAGVSRRIDSGTTLKLKTVRRNKTGALSSLRCELNGEDVILPKALKGNFRVLEDKDEQTVRDVVETYKLPQCVRFLQNDVKRLMSKDLQEAVDNMQSFRGEIIITGKTKSGPVLFGHYKGVDSHAASEICRRTAVVIPLHAQETEEVEVQLPKRKDTKIYEQFVVKVFPATKESSSVLEDALYVDFASTCNVQFLSNTDTPDVEPNKKPEPLSTEPPPPVPPRNSLVSDKQKPFDKNYKHQLPTIKVAPFRKEKKEASITSSPSSVGQGPKYALLDLDDQVGTRSLVTPLRSGQTSATRSFDTVVATSAHGIGQKYGALKFEDQESGQSSESQAVTVLSNVGKGPSEASASGSSRSVAATSPVAKARSEAPASRSSRSVAATIPVGKGPSEAPASRSSRSVAAAVPVGKGPSEAPASRSSRSVAAAPSARPIRLSKIGLLGDVFTQSVSSPDEDHIYEEPTDDNEDIYEDMGELHQHSVANYKGKVKRVLSNIVGKVKPDRNRFHKRSISEPAVEEVEPQDDHYVYLEAIKKDINDLSISELAHVLTECGMPDLARVCRQERVDGNLFSSFTPEILKKRPFFLNDWNVIKVGRIQNGWLPKL